MNRLRGREHVRVSDSDVVGSGKTEEAGSNEDASLARVMATPRTRRSSSIFSGLPAAMSDGMQPSATFRMKTTSHSCPLAEWMVDKIR